MQAMLLAAGLGARLRPLTQKTPKPLLRVGGETLLARHLRLLRAAGFAVVVNAAHLPEKIKAAAGKKAAVSQEPEPLGAAGGIRLAIARGLLPQNAPFAVVNADIYCGYDFAELKQKQIAEGGCYLILAPTPPEKKRGDFNCQGGMLRPGAEYTYCGIGVFHPALFAKIQPGEKAELLPLLRRAIKQKKAGAELFCGMWKDAGTPQSLAAARKTAAALKKEKTKTNAKTK